MSDTGRHKHKATYYNDIALRLAHQLFGLEHLHYGYFSASLKPEIKNITAAQNAYVKNLLTFIPRDVKDIFDVGCGTGGVAHELLKKKYTVTCLAPDPYLIEKTLENTNGRVLAITDLYENVEGHLQNSFDMILMSESCQYIKVDEGWNQHSRFLRDRGYVLAADFFRIREIDRPGISRSGHMLEDFLEAGKKAGFRLVKKTDITKYVAPTMDIYQGVILDKVFPIASAIFEFVERRYPVIYRILRFFARKSILRLKEKYSNQNAKIFTHYKGYFVLLFQKVG